jgi:putative transposase
VLLRLAYFGLTNTFALLRLLPTTDWDKDTELLVLWQQIAVLQRVPLEKPSLLVKRRSGIR